MVIMRRANGTKDCFWIIFFGTLVILLLYYVIQRKLSIIVADYRLSKKNIEINSGNYDLENIKMKEEKVSNIEMRIPTVKIELTTVKTLNVQTSHKELHAYPKEPLQKSAYVEVKPVVSGNSILWVYSDGALTLKNRIKNYVDKIEALRKDILSSRTQGNWTDVQEAIDVIWCNQDDFMQSLMKYNFVKTVALSWHPWKIHSSMKWTSLGDVSNLLVQKYYQWSASERLCQMIKNPGYTKARWDAVYRQECTTDSQLTSKAKSIDLVYFWGKPINKDHYWPNDGYRYPSYFYDTAPMFIFYMHITENVVITGLGDIISGTLKLVPYTCSQDIDPRPPPDYRTTLLYDEVFIMGQYWGEAFFHKMLENFPRIIPYVEFLQSHPRIMIHAAEVGGYTSFFLELLGIDPARLIKGVVRAKLVFMPQSTPCGFPHVQSAQLLSDRLRTEITKLYPNLQRNRVVLIQRSGSRRFTKSLEIEQSLRELAQRFNRTFQLFTDNPTPSPRDSMKIFKEAVLVVGPHGAGLSNLLYCEPGTFVIEGVCNPPHVNMCYQRTAHILGHHYHGIDSSSGCENVIDVQPGEIMKIAEVYLTIATKKDNLG